MPWRSDLTRPRRRCRPTSSQVAHSQCFAAVDQGVLMQWAGEAALVTFHIATSGRRARSGRRVAGRGDAPVAERSVWALEAQPGTSRQAARIGGGSRNMRSGARRPAPPSGARSSTCPRAGGPWLESQAVAQIETRPGGALHGFLGISTAIRAAASSPTWGLRHGAWAAPLQASPASPRYHVQERSWPLIHRAAGSSFFVPGKAVAVARAKLTPSGTGWAWRGAGQFGRTALPTRASCGMASAPSRS